MAPHAGKLERAIRIIDAISAWSGRITAWLILPLLAAMTYEVVIRYVATPTQWAYDTSYMLYGAMFMLGAAYTLYRGAHIRTDFLYQKWSVRTQATVDALCYLLLFFPGIAVFLWLGGEFAWNSWLRDERTVGSSWMPIIYPLKAVIPVAAALLLLQGVSEVLKCIYALRTGRWLATPRSLDEVLSREP
jgi:TRAP-type mannitol/chloroaromatic compound transport system permease small subunit